MKPQRPRWIGPALFPALIAALFLAIPPAGSTPRPDGGEKQAPSSAGETPLVEFAGRPAVEIRIGDRGPYLFLIGAIDGPVLLDPGLVSELDLEPGQDLSGIQVGDIELADLPFEQEDLSTFFSGAGAPRGILGLGAFAPYLVTLDTLDGKLWVESGTLGDAPQGAILTYHPGEEGIMTVPVEIGGQTVQAQIDIGGGGHLSLNNRYIEALSLSSAPSVIGRSITPEGEFPVLQAGFDGSARLGRLQVPLSSLRFMESVSDAVLSRDLLDAYRITFDPGEKRIRFALDQGKPIRMQEVAAAVANLDPDRPPLRDSFNADADKVRLLLILSPT